MNRVIWYHMNGSHTINKCYISGDRKYISKQNGECLIGLDKGYWTICSSCDLDYLLQKRWYCKVSTKRYIRAWAHIEKKSIFMSRYIGERMFNDISCFEIDHINRNPLDNRRENLRLATREQNCRNTFRTCKQTSNFKGVFFRKDVGKWRAQIRLARRGNTRSKTFNNEIDAAKQYNKWAEELFGEFAYINLI